MVPIRFIAEAADKDVLWHEQSQTVVIYSKPNLAELTAQSSARTHTHYWHKGYLYTVSNYRLVRSLENGEDPQTLGIPLFSMLDEFNFTFGDDAIYFAEDMGSISSYHLNTGVVTPILQSNTLTLPMAFKNGYLYSQTLPDSALQRISPDGAQREDLFSEDFCITHFCMNNQLIAYIPSNAETIVVRPLNNPNSYTDRIVRSYFIEGNYISSVACNSNSVFYTINNAVGIKNESTGFIALRVERRNSALQSAVCLQLVTQQITLYTSPEPVTIIQPVRIFTEWIYQVIILSKLQREQAKTFALQGIMSIIIPLMEYQ